MCNRSDGRMEVVCCKEHLEGFMRFAEFADAIDKLLGEAGPVGFPLWKTEASRPFPAGLVPALCGLLFRKLVVFLFLFGRLLRRVV